MKTIIKFSKEEVKIIDIQRRHNLSYMDVYKLKCNNVRGSFTLDGLEYDVEEFKSKKDKKPRSFYTISKGDIKYTELVPKEVSSYVGRCGSMISNKTIKTGSAVINGWLVEREGFVVG